MNVRPVVFLCGGSIAKSALVFEPIDQGTFISTSGIGICPDRKRKPMTDLHDRIVPAAMGFSCFRFPGRRNRRVD